MKRRARVLLLGSVVALALCGAAWAYAGSYGIHVLLRHGGSYWVTVDRDSPRLSASIRLAIDPTKTASPGAPRWTTIAPGFETADLPAMLDGRAVDHVLLARVDPARFRFVVRNAPDGDKGLDQWMIELGAALVVNGSYFGRDGLPDTPVISDGRALGPANYDAKAGAFVTSSGFTGIRGLASQDWRAAIEGADDAMVSYPLLVADGVDHLPTSKPWFANRSFVGVDRAGRVVIGTTSDAFFTLSRLARFLADAALDLTIALNLDGGPVASQAINLNGTTRTTMGRWEAQVDGDQVRLLTWPYGTVAMPVVLAVIPK